MNGSGDSPTKRIVILGAGFGGVYAYLALRRTLRHRDDIKITLVSDRDYFLFVTLIHEVATGSLLPQSITQSLRALPRYRGAHFIEGHVRGVRLDEREVLIDAKQPRLEDIEREGHGHTPRTISYDYLISALGSVSDFSACPSAEEYATPLKTRDDAVYIKNRVIDSFEYASGSASAQERKTALRFVIIGGGATGVEVAGELADYVHGELARAYSHLTGLASVVLVHAGDRLIAGARAWFGKRAEKILARKGVEVLCETRAKEITREGVVLPDGELIRSRTVLWTTGVRATPLPFQARVEPTIDERTGRVKVNNDLSLPAHKNVFVVGDQAWIKNKGSGQPYPMRAQFAERQGVVAAENIARSVEGAPRKKFEWSDKGFIVSLGKGGALAEVFGVRFSGFFAWWVYRTAYALKIVGARTKLRTILEWTLNVFFPRDITRL